jgi:hypothetical protein
MAEDHLVVLDRRGSLLAVAAGLAVVPAVLLWGEDEDFPSFKAASSRESREFVTRVGEVIVKAARSRPRKIELKDFTYASPKAGRKELTLKMTYTGAVTKVKFNVDVELLLDTEDKDKWEVLNIRYSDSNRSPVPFSEKKVQDLIKQFNK